MTHLDEFLVIMGIVAGANSPLQALKAAKLFSSATSTGCFMTLVLLHLSGVPWYLLAVSLTLCLINPVLMYWLGRASISPRRHTYQQ